MHHGLAWSHLLPQSQESANKESIVALAQKGADIVSVNYTDKAALTTALKGVDVVISTLTSFALEQQITLAETAKEAGVKAFVPSEFGTPSQDLLLHRVLRRLHFDPVSAPRLHDPDLQHTYNLYCCSQLDLDLKSGKARVGGDGNAKISFTSRHDIARYVVFALTELSASELHDKAFKIEASRAVRLGPLFIPIVLTVGRHSPSMRSEDKYGQKLDVKHSSLEELRDSIKANHDISTILRLLWAEGDGLVGEPIDNYKYPDWIPKPVLDYL